MAARTIRPDMILGGVLALPLIGLLCLFPRVALWSLALLLLLEAAAWFVTHTLKKQFQWLITPEDRHPHFDRVALEKFMRLGHDPQLGWVRKPDTQKEEIGQYGRLTTYHIDKDGARLNHGHDSYPKDIMCFGDSFAFCRQVNDGETFEWFLSEKTKKNVMNFGVGNYGLDQALLRLEREYPKHKAKIVIMGVVPSTIVRILSVWKHYNEFGNIFGFKPRYIVKDGKLQLVENFIDSKEKFLRYSEYLPAIHQHDPFYLNKFEKDMIRFPYLVSILTNPFRNIPLLALAAWDRLMQKNDRKEPYPLSMKVIMDSNLHMRVSLFKKNQEAMELLGKLVIKFVQYGHQHKFTPIFMWMPQKDDLLFIKETTNYYEKFIADIRNREVPVIDLTEHLLEHDDLDSLYCDRSRYGGHFSRKGNELIAEIIFNYLTQGCLL